jgi:hypothetical protein
MTSWKLSSLLSTQTNQLYYNDNIWNGLQTKASAICREQRQRATQQSNQHYQQLEQTIDDNDEYDIFDLNDNDLFDLDRAIAASTTN